MHRVSWWSPISGSRSVHPWLPIKWRDELIGKVEELSENPLRHPVAPESEKFPREIRLMLFRKRRGQFRIYYTINQKRVVILSVRRSARKPLEKEDLEL